MASLPSACCIAFSQASSPAASALAPTILQAPARYGEKSVTMVGSERIVCCSCATYLPSGLSISHLSAVKSQISAPNSRRILSAALGRVRAGIRCCSTGFISGSTMEEPLKGPTGSQSASGSDQEAHADRVGRLEVMVKPMPARCSRCTADRARIGQRLVLGQQRAVDVGDHEGDFRHGRTSGLDGARVSAARFQLAHDAVNDRLDRGSSIETVMTCSPASGGSSVSNWLVSSPGGMKWPLRWARRSAISFLAALQEDEAHILAPAQQNVAIGVLQRRAGDDDVLAAVAHPRDLVGDGVEPGPAVLVGEGMAGLHLGDIAGGVKAVAVLEPPAEPLAEGFRDRALARARHAHHDQCTRCFSAAHENPPEARPGRPARRSRPASARVLPAESRH